MGDLLQRLGHDAASRPTARPSARVRGRKLTTSVFTSALLTTPLLTTAVLTAAAATLATLVVPMPQARAATEYEALFDGQSLAGWSLVNDAPISAEGGVLRVEGSSGWLRSEKPYGDFALRAEFRFLTDDADSGLFVRVAEDGGEFVFGWPNDSYQIQLRNPLGQSPFPPIGGLLRHGRPPGETSFDPADAARLSRGTGEWQTLDVEVVGDTLTVSLNGEVLTEAAGVSNASGYIGLQAERGVLEFRSIEIAER